MTKKKQVRITELKGVILGALYRAEHNGVIALKAVKLAEMADRVRMKEHPRNNFRTTLKNMQEQGFVKVWYQKQNELVYMHCQLTDKGRDNVPEQFKQD